MRMWNGLFAQARGVVLAVGAGVGADQSIGVLAQTLPSLSDAYLVQLAEKGGGWVVLLIVLFFYRRDYQRLTTSENEMRKELLEAVQKQAESEQKLAVALMQNTEVMRRVISEEEGRR